ncbi:uncharacterized protein LOC144026296 [Festucalex cinctus]
MEFCNVSEMINRIYLYALVTLWSWIPKTQTQIRVQQFICITILLYAGRTHDETRNNKKVSRIKRRETWAVEMVGDKQSPLRTFVWNLGLVEGFLDSSFYLPPFRLHHPVTGTMVSLLVSSSGLVLEEPLL